MYIYITGTYLEGEGGGLLSCPFSKFKKSALILGKKCPNYIHLGLNFSFKMLL